MNIEHWIVNILIFSLPFTWHMIYAVYKELKKKDKIIENLTNHIIGEDGTR